VVPVKVYLDASSRCEEALPNITFHATEMAGAELIFVYICPELYPNVSFV
jgi:hypothetical protein